MGENVNYPSFRRRNRVLGAFLGESGGSIAVKKWIFKIVWVFLIGTVTWKKFRQIFVLAMLLGEPPTKEDTSGFQEDRYEEGACQAFIAKETLNFTFSKFKEEATA